MEIFSRRFLARAAKQPVRIFRWSPRPQPPTTKAGPPAYGLADLPAICPIPKRYNGTNYCPSRMASNTPPKSHALPPYNLTTYVNNLCRLSPPIFCTSSPPGSKSFPWRVRPPNDPVRPYLFSKSSNVNPLATPLIQVFPPQSRSGQRSLRTSRIRGPLIRRSPRTSIFLPLARPIPRMAPRVTVSTEQQSDIGSDQASVQ